MYLILYFIIPNVNYILRQSDTFYAHFIIAIFYSGLEWFKSV